jgi:indolepyruvate ferredoxin oxidoreductase, alpha subunit
MDKLFSGLDAIVLAVKDIGVPLITYVPGYPITELSKALRAEIALNEKVAFEISLGASATGSCSMVVVKQVGMNILADPLAISATHAIGSGLIVIAGDDLGPRGSQIEMDSRFYGPLTKLPVLDPRDPETLYNSIKEAFLLSLRLKIPIIVRVTRRLLSSSQSLAASSTLSSSASSSLSSSRSGASFPTPPQSIQFAESRLDFDWTAWELTASARLQKYRQEILPLSQAASEATSLNSIQIRGDVGIIASGYPAKIAKGLGVSLLAVGYANPLPWKLVRRFIDDHDLLLIAEEPEPFIESQLQMSPKIRGKLTGHLPYGILERADIMNALKDLKCEPDGKIRSALQSYEHAEKRGFSGICDDCPFELFYRALAKIDVPVAGDAGCSIRATRPPYDSVDVVYGMGSSISVASGFQRKGIAVIGDFAFGHTGIIGLLNAIWQKRNVLVVILQNGIAATTGGQEAPDLSDLVRSLVPTRLIDQSLSEEEIEKILKEELMQPGPSSVLFVGKCPRKDIKY